ncbi:MAG: SLC13 family permease [Promethearchaeota archaeon]
MDLILLIIIFVIFGIVILSYTRSNLDFVAISLLCCFIAASITFVVKGTDLHTFIVSIEWPAILIILSMSIITKIAQDSNILEYVAVKLFKISNGDQRIFFWLLCIITTLLAAIISDVVVVLILAPIVIRLCNFLKIRSGTYLLGMTICINIGSIITPFSSGENIIISTAFNLDTLYFIQYFWIFSFLLLFLTIFLIDKFILSKEPKIEEQQKRFVIDLIDTDVMVKNKKMFYLNSIAIITMIILFVALPVPLYLTAVVSTLILVLVNRKFTKKPMSELLKDIEWEIIFFFISLYVIIECLIQAGFTEIFTNLPFRELNPIFLSFLILIIVSFVSGFVANTPTALIFNTIIMTLIAAPNYFEPVPLLFAFIIGINLGGNIIPQGAACDMMTLKIAQDSGVDNLNYKRLLKTGATFAFIHIGLAAFYLIILSAIFV